MFLTVHEALLASIHASPLLSGDWFASWSILIVLRERRRSRVGAGTEVAGQAEKPQ